MTHKEQLEEWWALAADSFPGEFHVWLQDRINSGESEDVVEDIMVLLKEYKDLEYDNNK